MRPIDFNKWAICTATSMIVSGIFAPLMLDQANQILFAVTAGALGAGISIIWSQYP